MKKIIVAILVVDLIVVAGYFLLKSLPQANPNLAFPTVSTSTPTSTSTVPTDPDPNLTYEEHTFTTNSGEAFSLSLPAGYTISLAASGLGRVRFMDMSPDGRLFVTDMKNLSDSPDGEIYILDAFNEQTKRFESKKTYLSRLRNPNSIAFYKDASDKTWIYIALTDRLIRYAYAAGDDAPQGEPETLATYPDYGLNYKYGGWHLTRTVYILNDKVYVSVGSSCNSCEEKESESVRATISEMNPDGTGQKIIATGARNSVGLTNKEGELYASAMGADHLGSDRPEDAVYKITEGKNYGWPYCYQYQGVVYPDTAQIWKKPIDCSTVPLAFATVPAHSAPLGLAYFDNKSPDELKNSMLLALHGSGIVSLGRGYSIVKIDEKGNVSDFVTGFWKNGVRYGRPVGILKVSPTSFYFTDDFSGRLYLVSKE
ncbi:MAG: PQQ-dependent sugar dehydrogenase [Patescibacteria group bacterium]